MNIKILTPEKVIFSGEVESVLLPGKNGEFHIMKNHAPVVSSLVSGKVKLFTNDIPADYQNYLTQENDGHTYFAYPIKSGVIEYNHDKGIILAE